MSLRDRFDTTLETIYAAALDPARWQDALSSIEELTGSAGAVLDFAPLRPGVQPRAYAGRFTREQCEEYATQYMALCRRIDFAIRHPEIPIQYDAMVLSEQEMDRDPVYDWLGKHGLRYYVGGQLGCTGDYHVSFSMQRTSAAGHAQREDIELAGVLCTHLRQAVTLADRIGTLTEQTSVQLAILENAPRAIVILRADGEVHFANRRARDLLAERDGLALQDRRLECMHPASRRRLEALAFAADSFGGWVGIERPSGRPSYAAFIARMRGSEPLPGGGAEQIVLIIHDPAAPAATPDAALEAVYGLTAAEARVARAIALGWTAQETAATLGVSPETVRSHLKGLFRKLHVNRQQDVVRIVLGLSAMWESHPNG
ncbi:MAG TPA: helix-turn-helix transcriptional regulator [Allosphingosinicella sp.]|jgi:DNA-binding CsgD family transcriptional regulator/PAS domain-containing protein|nr:helix-turn-helix transcriptional regulator [Allosphingosinicella sp.]